MPPLTLSPQNTQTSTPATSSGGFLQQLGIAPGYAFGGKQQFPSTTTPSNGVQAANPTQNVATPSTSISAQYAAPASTGSPGTPSASQIQSLAASNPTALNFLPGESPQAYNSRIATLMAGQGGGQTGSTGGGNLATLPQAPVGYQADATIPPASTATTTTTPTTQNPSYSGLINQLSGNASGAYQTGATNAQSALGSAQGFINQLQQSQQNEAGGLAGIGNEAIPLQFQQGRQQVLQSQYTQQQAALGSAANAEAALYGPSITAQGQGLSAQGTATQAAAPANTNVQVPYSNQYLNASTGQPVDPAQAQAMQSAVALEAQKVQNNQETYAQAQANLSNYSQAGLNALNQALGPNFNANTNAGASAGQTAAAGAGGQAQAQNTVTAETAGTSTAAQGYQQSVQAYQSANTAYSTAQQQSTNLQSAMSGINGLNSQYANSAINSLQSQFGSAKYSSFITSLNEAKQAYTTLLSSVGASTPTVNGQQATDIFNAASTPAQINAAISALDNAAYAKLQPLYQQAVTYQNNLGGGTGGGASTSIYSGW